MKTVVTKPADVEYAWYVVDADGQTLGRLASKVATILRGKHKPTYDPSVDCGDFVIIINAEKFHVTGRKMDQKMYFWESKVLRQDSLLKVINLFSLIMNLLLFFINATNSGQAIRCAHSFAQFPLAVII